MFANCEQLKTVVVHDEMEEIGSNAFSNCISLQTFKLPKKVRRIGNYAFMNCKSLTCIDIPEAIKTIGDDALSSCSSLEYIKMFAAMPPFLESYGVFQDTNECPIYVFEESLDNYLFDWKWSDYSHRIIPMNVNAPKGDVNGDGSVNVTDVITIINFILDRELGTFLPYLADVNADGEVNISDAIGIIRQLLNEH